MKQRINISLVFIAMLAIIATSLGITYVYYGLFQNQVESDLRMDARLLRDACLFEENDDFKEAVDNLATEDIRITWIDTDGTVLYDNDVEANMLENHINRPEIKDALLRGEGNIIRKSDTVNMDTYYYALRLKNGTVLRIAKEAQTILSMFMNVLPLMIILVLLISFVCIGISRAFTKRLIQPIYQMAENLDGIMDQNVYSELLPFANKIRNQHENILLAAKSRQDFTANVSHELKTPLTAISGYAELIENKMIPEEKTTYFAEQIRNNANRLLSLINDIIRLSELDHIELERIFMDVNLYQLAQTVCENLRLIATRKRIRLQVFGDECIIKGDLNLIRELLENLIQNAIQYSNENGYVQVHVEKKEENTILRIKDNGIGIPKNAQDRIFERFYRVDKSRSRQTGGTGLGLAIVKHIVEIHDAQIEVSSELSVGTEFIVKF